MDETGGVAESAAVSQDEDPQITAQADRLRRLFDCSGTVWSTYKRLDGKPTCHGMPIATGAPDVLACGVRIEYQSGPGVYETVPPDGKYAPDEVTPEFLYELGGGRRYRLSLRFRGNTIPHSYLTFDLGARGDAKPFAHEEGGTSKPGAKGAPPRPPPTADAADSMLRLGGDPVAALLGAAVGDLTDPTTKLAFALLLRDGQRAQEYADRVVGMSQNMISTMAGALKSAAGGGGESAMSVMLREQAAAASRAAEASAAEARQAREALHAREIAAIRAEKSEAPPAWLPHALGAGERLLGNVATAMIQTAGADSARKVVEGVASAAATAAGVAAGG